MPTFLCISLKENLLLLLLSVGVSFKETFLQLNVRHYRSVSISFTPSVM